MTLALFALFLIPAAWSVRATCNSSVIGIDSGMNITFFSDDNCNTQSRQVSIKYQSSMTGFLMGSFQPSRPFQASEQLDFSTFGYLINGPVWSCANWTGSFSTRDISNDGSKCYQSPTNGSECARLVNWDLCTFPLGGEYPVSSGQPLTGRGFPEETGKLPP